MKMRHAVALALTGWYLMIPPQLDKRTVDQTAPISKWTVYSPHDTADACHLAQVEQRTIAEQKATQIRDQDVGVVLRQFLESQCIASDDPRLRP